MHTVNAFSVSNSWVIMHFKGLGFSQVLNIDRVSKVGTHTHLNSYLYSVHKLLMHHF